MTEVETVAMDKDSESQFEFASLTLAMEQLVGGKTNEDEEPNGGAKMHQSILIEDNVQTSGLHAAGTLYRTASAIAFLGQAVAYRGNEDAFTDEAMYGFGLFMQEAEDAIRAVAHHLTAKNHL